MPWVDRTPGGVTTGFAQRGEQFAHNVRNYYDYCRDRDLFLTHAIVNPQIDRSKSSSEQAEPFIHLGMVDQTRDGLVVRGAKMLATHGPTADELLRLPSGTRVVPPTDTTPGSASMRAKKSR